MLISNNTQTIMRFPILELNMSYQSGVMEEMIYDAFLHDLFSRRHLFNKECAWSALQMDKFCLMLMSQIPWWDWPHHQHEPGATQTLWTQYRQQTVLKSLYSELDKRHRSCEPPDCRTIYASCTQFSAVKGWSQLLNCPWKVHKYGTKWCAVTKNKCGAKAIGPRLARARLCMGQWRPQMTFCALGIYLLASVILSWSLPYSILAIAMFCWERINLHVQ